jgi:hypothetical protein
MQEISKQYMLHEYDTLRAEILDIYREQTRLVFATAITGAFVLYAKQLESIPEGFILPAILTIILGIGIKSIANYHRLFRIGGYLSLVHEKFRQNRSVPTPREGAWHTTWSKLRDTKNFRLVGMESAIAEAVFLCLVAVLAWAVSIGTHHDWANPVSLCLSIVLSVVLAEVLRRLLMVLKKRKIYADAFEEYIYTFPEELN